MRSLPADTGTWTPPEQFEEYRLLQELGRGAMGRVFLARDVLLDRLVAVKFILAPEPSPQLRERFFTEARALARLQHPNVVAVYRVGEVQQRPYLVSEYIRGQRLDQLPRPVDPKRALELAVCLARGLAAAHRVNILHRDIKPSNTLVSEAGEIKLVDFGLAELLDRPGARPPDESGYQRRTAAAEPDETLELPALVRPPRKDQRSSTGPATDPERSAVGTPRYMAPELWRGEQATRAADVYSLGMVLYELFTGRTAFSQIPLPELAEHVQNHPAPSLAALAPRVAPALAAVLEACLSRDASARPPSGDSLLALLEARAATVEEADCAAAPPYPGLAAFTSDQRGTFFGRSAEVRGIVERLRTAGVAFVTGDSGVGKSSVCRAGVLPALARGVLGPAPRLIALTPGLRPGTSLRRALAPLLPAGVPPDPLDLARALRRLGEGTRVVLFVDQLEELWTFADPQESEDAVRLLGAILQLRACVLLATLRSDFLTRLSGAPVLGEELGPSLFLLRPLAEDSLREAIRAPAEARGYRFESEATLEALVAACRGAPGGLPLVQFTLAALWDRRDEQRRLIPANALERLGGVDAALARHADQVLAALPAEQRASAQRMLCELVTPEGTRRRRSAVELLVTDADRRALNALVAGRLVVASEREAAATAQYEIAHEALLRGWDTLRGWLGRDEEKRAMRHRLERSAVEWDRLGRTRELLWGARQVQDLKAAIDPGALAPVVADFVRASGMAVRRRRVLRWAGAVVVPLSLLLVLGGLQWRSHQELRTKVLAKRSQAAQVLATVAADVQALRAEHAATVFAIEAGDKEGRELHWRSVIQLIPRVEKAQREARSLLEAALLLDSSGQQTREALTQLAWDRADLLSRLSRVEEADTEARRALSYQGTDAQLKVQARLQVSPPSAALTLERYSFAGEPQSVRRLTPGGDQTLQLDPGSYVLVAEAPGHAPIRFPFLATYQAKVEVSLELPRAELLPPGFVFIPAGDFLFGSGEAEELRLGFYGAPPLHASRTGAYLIARHEVTFAQWFTYLRTLSAAQQAPLLPAAEDRGHRLGVRRGSAGGYLLDLEIAGHRYSLREGEPLRYAKRSHRAEVDWARLPVAGISYNDAAGYLHWLSRSGAVPGARFCTEREWERAARGADTRLFPTGPQLPPDAANVDVTYGREPGGFGPDEVGSHATGRSPLGVEDLAGNVWEIVNSAEVPHRPMMRGGGWYQGELTARAVNRESLDPVARATFVGLRVCAPANP
ncbi:MAG: protein kinase [Myxococcota bacterium]|nr:protein kinase [Myxococcota bacterium]